MRFLIFALFFFCSMAQANDATHCIELGESKKDESRTLTNTCENEVIVFWCHHGDKKGTRDAACNPEKKFYRPSWPLKKDEVKTNRYQLPLNTEITYGACFGSWGSYTLLNGEGGYYCNPIRLPASGSERRVLHTFKGANIDEACVGALESARVYGRASECACETHKSVSVCRVESTGKGMGDLTGAEKLRRKAIEELREASKCDPSTGVTCTPRPSANPGGIRN